MATIDAAGTSSTGDGRPDRGRLPPGPTVLFFVLRARALADPHRILDVFRELVRRWGPVCAVRSGLRSRDYFVASHSVAEAVFRAHHAFAKYPHPTDDIAKLQALIGKGMLATHTDDDWARHRQSLAPLLGKVATLKNFAGVVTRHVDALLGEAAARGPHECNVSELCMRLSGRVMSDLLSPGHRLADNNFLKIKKLLDESILEFHRRDFTRRAVRYKAALREQAVELVETAAADPAAAGLVQRMIQDEPSWQSDPTARARLLDRTINLVVSGYETTATTLNWVAYLLAAGQAVQEQLRREADEQLYQDGTAPYAFDDRSLLRRAIAEAMRLHSVLWFNIRYAVEETVLEGVRFTKGARVMLLPFIANRSPEVHAEPDSFCPDRYLRGEPPPLFPFGNGPRVCIGRPLAELEMQAFVVGLVRRFRLEALGTPNAIGGVLLQPDRDVTIRLVPRAPGPAAACGAETTRNRVPSP